MEHQQQQPGLGNIGGEIDLHRVIHEIKSAKRFIAIVVAVMVLIGTVLSFSMKPSYQTDALIQVKQGQNPISALSSLADMVSTFSMSSSQMPPQAQVESMLISSRYVLGKVIEQLHLDIAIRPDYFPILGKLKANHYKGKGLAPAFMGMTNYPWGGEKLVVTHMHVADAAINKKEAFKLTVTGKNTYALYDSEGQLMFHGVVGKAGSSGGQNPMVAMTVGELFARPGVSFEVRKLSLQDEIKALNSQIAVNNQQTKNGILDITFKWGSPAGAVNILNSIIDTAYQLGVKQQSEEAEKTLQFLDKQLPKVKAQLTTAENALSDYQTKSGNFNLSVQAQVMLQQVMQVNNQLEQLKLKRTELLQNYTKDHPFVVTLDHKIAQVQKELTHLDSQLRQLPEQDKGSVELMRDVKTKNQLYLMLLGKAQEMQILRAGVVSNLRILDYASEPPLLLPVKHALIIVVSGLAGLIFSILFVLARHLLQRGVQDPDMVERVTGLPTQAIVPYSKQQENILESLVHGAKEGVGILARSAPKDIAVEALRSLRTTLQLMMLDAPNNILAISGMIPSIGKSFISTNLAYVIADMGKRVLLIDTDMRKGHIHKNLNLKNAPGLSDYLQGRATAEEIVHTIEKDCVHFIAKGSHCDNTSELMMGSRMKALLDELAPHFDMILMDTAPVLIVADGIIASALAGTTLLVVGAGKNTEQELSRGMAMLKQNDVNVKASIFNHREKSASQGGYYYYDYAYKYYDAYRDDKNDHKTN